MISSDYSRLCNDCILCGRCLEVCPLFQSTNDEEYSPRAKAFLLQLLSISNETLSNGHVRKLAGICLSCGRCTQACPQNIDLPTALAKFKSESPSWKSWLWSCLIRSMPKTLPILSHSAPALSPFLMGDTKNRLLALKEKSHHILTLRFHSIRSSYKNEQALLFPGCIARYAKKKWIKTAYRILYMSGLNVLGMPDWSCCGYSIQQAGLLETSLTMQENNLSIWRSYGKPYIMTFCATCRHALEGMVNADLNWHDNEKDEWLQSIVTISSLLNTSEISLSLYKSLRSAIFLHHSCHARSDVWQWLMKNAPVTVDFGTIDKCCGLGGSLILERPEMLQPVVADLWSSVHSYRDGLLLTACNGCDYQLTTFNPWNFETGHWLDFVEIHD